MRCPHCNKEIIQKLSEREIQVLNFAARGYSNLGIAKELLLSDQTIKNFVSRILHKLSAKNRAHAVTRGIQEGYIKL